VGFAIRQEIADAANTIEGIKATPYFRQTTRPGDAYVRLDRWVRDDTGFGYMATWALCVLLPQDLTAAEEWLETNLETVVTAIEEVLIVTAATPSRLALDTGTIPVVMIEGTRAI
jgi:hypothetical protein